jgi:hypothetical protein
MSRVRRLLPLPGLVLLPAGAQAAGAPWPTMRHDMRNTGRSRLPARFDGSRPWRVRTGKGIFSMLPARLRAWVVADVFPLSSRTLR